MSDENIKREMWEHARKTLCFAQVICPKCGGSVQAFCKCQYESFKPTLEQKQAFKNKQKVKIIQNNT